MLTSRIANLLLTPDRLQFVKVVLLFVRRDLKIKYRDSVLGYIWSMLNPLLFMIIINFVFQHVMKGIPNYSLYVLAGILTWNMGSVTISVGTHSVLSNSHLLRKIKVPIWVFPMASLGMAATNFVLALIPYIIVHVVLGIGFSWQILFVPVVLVFYFVFLLGLSLALSSMNVFFRDIGHVLEPVLTLVFYATPIIYSLETLKIPDSAKLVLQLNPFCHFVDAMRSCLLTHASFGFGKLGLCGLLAAGSLLFGLTVYKVAKPKILFSV